MSPETPTAKDRLRVLAAVIVKHKDKFTRGDIDGRVAIAIDSLAASLEGRGDPLEPLCHFIVLNKDNFTVGDYTRSRAFIIERLGKALEDIQKESE